MAGMSHILPVRRVGRLPRARFRAFSADPPRRSSLESLSRGCPALATEVTERGIAGAISASTVRRILAADTIKPWQYRSWLFIRDPDFAAKATRVLDLYARVWDGVPLTGDEYVISSDEKTSI